MRPTHPVIAIVDLNTNTVTPTEPAEVTTARFHAICDKWKEATGTVHPAISALARACQVAKETELGPSLEPDDDGNIGCPSCGNLVPACYWPTGLDMCRTCERDSL